MVVFVFVAPLSERRFVSVCCEQRGEVLVVERISVARAVAFVIIVIEPACCRIDLRWERRHGCGLERESRDDGNGHRS